MLMKLLVPVERHKAGEVLDIQNPSLITEYIKHKVAVFATDQEDNLRRHVVDHLAQATADVKELAAIKSPTELFQLQGKIMRRNFEALVATGSKNTEAVLKLTKDTFAPLSGRVNLAAEKLAKVA